MNQSNALQYRIPIVDALNGFVQRVGHVMAWVNVLLIGVILFRLYCAMASTMDWFIWRS